MRRSAGGIEFTHPSSIAAGWSLCLSATTKTRRWLRVHRTCRPGRGAGAPHGSPAQFRLARAGRAPNGAGRVRAGEPELPELVVWHEFLDQRKELSLLKPDVCVQQLSRGIQRLSVDDAGSHGDFEFASEPLELHVLDACLAEGSRLRRDVPEEEREELFFPHPEGGHALRS